MLHIKSNLGNANALPKEYLMGERAEKVNRQ